MEVVSPPNSFYNSDPVAIACPNLYCNAILKVSPSDVIRMWKRPDGRGRNPLYFDFRCPCCQKFFTKNLYGFNRWDINQFKMEIIGYRKPEPEPKSWWDRLFSS